MRIPWSFSNSPSGISENQPAADPLLQRISMTCAFDFAANRSRWNLCAGGIGFGSNFIIDVQIPGVSKIVWGLFSVFICSPYWLGQTTETGGGRSVASRDRNFILITQPFGMAVIPAISPSSVIEPPIFRYLSESSNK